MSMNQNPSNAIRLFGTLKPSSIRVTAAIIAGG
jgi:hypothetical protein